MSIILLIFNLFVAVALIIVVLIQKSEGGGLGIGGGTGGLGSFMTSRGTANLLTRTTAVLAALFMLISLALALIKHHQDTVQNTFLATPAVKIVPKTSLPARIPNLPVPGGNVLGNRQAGQTAADKALSGVGAVSIPKSAE